METTLNTVVEAVELDELRLYLAHDKAGHVPTSVDRELLTAMAANVTGWTHTTRLREFVEAHAPKAATA